MKLGFMFLCRTLERSRTRYDKNRNQLQNTLENRFMIFGPHPLDGENTRIFYGRLMDDVKAKITEELELMRTGKLSHPDCGFMGYIFALNRLATEDKAIQSLSLGTRQKDRV